MKMNKKYFWTGIVLILVMLITSNTQASTVVLAATTTQVNYVSNVDNVLYPSTSQFYTLIGSRGVASFSISEPAVIKGYLNWDTTLTAQTNIWFSRDQSGIDLIDAPKTLDQKNNYKQVFLDPGTYYINYQLGKASTSSNEDLSTIRVGICLLGQLANSTENIYASSYEFPNTLELNKTERGFLSTTSPVDYYRFGLKEKSMVTVTYDFTAFNEINLGSGSISLRNEDNQLIKTQNYSHSGVSSNTFHIMLEKGTYYIEMKGATTTTTLNVSAVSYVVKQKMNPSGYTKNSIKITLTIPYEYSQILLVKGKVAAADAESWSIWNTTYEDCSELKTSGFTAEKNGTYTLRIRDPYGNFNLHYVKISAIDRTPPKITGVFNGKRYKSPVTVKFTDDKSGIKNAALNGKKISSGKKISAKGSYLLKVWDKAGNVKTLKFYIG